jgi:ABC-type anion transport system duplicated permease subunit
MIAMYDGQVRNNKHFRTLVFSMLISEYQKFRTAPNDVLTSA